MYVVDILLFLLSISVFIADVQTILNTVSRIEYRYSCANLNVELAFNDLNVRRADILYSLKFNSLDVRKDLSWFCCVPLLHIKHAWLFT